MPGTEGDDYDNMMISMVKMMKLLKVAAKGGRSVDISPPWEPCQIYIRNMTVTSGLVGG